VLALGLRLLSAPPATRPRQAPVLSAVVLSPSLLHRWAAPPVLASCAVCSPSALICLSASALFLFVRVRVSVGLQELPFVIWCSVRFAPCTSHCADRMQIATLPKQEHPSGRSSSSPFQQLVLACSWFDFQYLELSFLFTGGIRYMFINFISVAALVCMFVPVALLGFLRMRSFLLFSPVGSSILVLRICFCLRVILK
jgi:hypothetical protein